MKKILSVLTLVCFVAVNVSLAQSAPQASEKETKTEVVKADAKATTPSCCKHSAKACSSKSEAASKSCSPKEKAACKDGAKTEASKKETKSGTN